MIVIGVDVHKHSFSAVAVDEVGRQLDALETSEGEELVAWSKRVGRKRLWALEDCRHVTRGLGGDAAAAPSASGQGAAAVDRAGAQAGPGAGQGGSDRCPHDR